jgi:hypothetical protein
MTTPAKQYQNVSFQELLQFAQTNPNRAQTLDAIEVIATKAAQETSLENLGLKGYQAYHLNPTGIISLLVCIADPTYYSLAAPAARTQQIIDMATTLQEQTEQLRNSHLTRKRKKIHDLIGAAYNGAVLEDKDYLDLFAGLAYLKEIQFVMLKSAVQEEIEEGKKQYDSALQGEILFSSSPEVWKRDRPVWIVDYRTRWVAVPSENHAKPSSTFLHTWLPEIEQNGWIVQWPEVEGTKAELVAELSTLPSWQPADKSLLKDTLAVRLGKIKTLRNLSDWSETSVMDEL